MSTRSRNTQANYVRLLADCLDETEIYGFPVALSSEFLKHMGMPSANYHLAEEPRNGGAVLFERDREPRRIFAGPDAKHILVDFEERKLWFLNGAGGLSDVHEQKDGEILAARLSAMGEQSPLRKFDRDIPFLREAGGIMP